jgi:hypothetical protein
MNRIDNMKTNWGFIKEHMHIDNHYRYLNADKKISQNIYWDVYFKIRQILIRQVWTGCHIHPATECGWRTHVE